MKHSLLVLALLGACWIGSAGAQHPSAEQKEAMPSKPVPTREEQHRMAVEMLRGGEMGKRERAAREARIAARKAQAKPAATQSDVGKVFNSQGAFATQEEAKAALEAAGSRPRTD